MDKRSISLSQESGTLPDDCRFLILTTSKGDFRLTSRTTSPLWAMTAGRTSSSTVETYTYTAVTDQQWYFQKYSLSLSASKSQIEVGDTLRINPSTNALPLTWSTSDSKVATVSGGLVTARGVGTATITAKASNGIKTSYTITILAKAIQLTQGTPVAGNITQGGEHWYKFTPTQRMNYTFSTYGSTNTYGQLYQGTTLLQSNDNNANDQNFNLSRTLTPGTEYRLKVKGASSTTNGNYSVIVTSDIYGSFSSVANNYPVNEARNEAINISNQQFDVWPASSLSRYYEWNSTERTNVLSTIYQLALTTCGGGLVVQQPDAAGALFHFLTGDGANYTISVNDLCNESEQIEKLRKDRVNDLLEASERIVSISKTKTIYNCENKNFIVESINDNTNWQNTLGGCEFRIKATVTRTSSNRFTANVQFSVIDFYDWDRTQTSMGTKPVSPQDMWELHHGGMAKNFLTTGTSTLSITWTKGQRWGSGASITINS